MIHLNAQLILHEPYGLATRKSVSRDDSGGVNLRFYELVCTAQQLGGDDHDRSRTITDFFVLFLCEIYKYTACGMFYRKERKDGGAVI